MRINIINGSFYGLKANTSFGIRMTEERKTEIALQYNRIRQAIITLKNQQNHEITAKDISVYTGIPLDEVNDRLKSTRGKRELLPLLPYAGKRSSDAILKHMSEIQSRRDAIAGCEELKSALRRLLKDPSRELTYNELANESGMTLNSVKSLLSAPYPECTQLYGIIVFLQNKHDPNSSGRDYAVKFAKSFIRDALCNGSKKLPMDVFEFLGFTKEDVYELTQEVKNELFDNQLQVQVELKKTRDMWRLGIAVPNYDDNGDTSIDHQRYNEVQQMASLISNEINKVIKNNPASLSILTLARNLGYSADEVGIIVSSDLFPELKNKYQLALTRKTNSEVNVENSSY